MARALMWVTLCPWCKEISGVAVKGLLTQPVLLLRRAPYDAERERARAAPAAPDRDHCRRELVARPRGGAPPRRGQGGRRPRCGCLLRLSLRRADRRARAPGDPRTERRRDDTAAPDASRRGDHRQRRFGARPGDDPVGGAPRPTLQAVSEPAGGGIRVDPRGADPGPRRAGGCAERTDARAARISARRGGAAPVDRRPGRPVDRARAALLAGAAPRRRVGGAREDL